MPPFLGMHEPSGETPIMFRRCERLTLPSSIGYYLNTLTQNREDDRPRKNGLCSIFRAFLGAGAMKVFGCISIKRRFFAQARSALYFVALTVCVVHINTAMVDGQPSTKPKTMCANANGLTNDEIDAIVKSHNRFRAELKLAPLTWDCKLADRAQDWARRGVAAHRGDTAFGENIFVASSSDALAVMAVDPMDARETRLEQQVRSMRSGKDLHSLHAGHSGRRRLISAAA
jgi:hypothetical protein